MAVKFEKLVKDTADTMKKAGKKKISEYDTNGVVKRVDGKTAWVHFDGGVDETPVRMTISAKAGDKVRVHVGGGKAYITGNETAPPTDDREAKKASTYAGEAYKASQDAQNSADKAQKTANDAMSAADALEDDLESLAGDVDDISDLVGDGDESGIEVITQYYLSTSNSSPVGGEWVDSLPTYVSGKYYWTRTVTIYADGSEVEGTAKLDTQSQIAAEVNEVVTAENQHFWHDSTGAYVTTSDQNLGSGYAMKITTYGLLQTYNGNNLMSLTSSGLTFYQSDGSTPMASYSSSGATIYGGSTGYRAEMSSSGFQVYTNSTLMATFGSSVTLGNSSGYHTYFSGGELGVRNGSTTYFYTSENGLYYRSGYYWGLELNGRYGFSVSVNNSDVFKVNSSGVTAGTITSSSTGDALVADSGSIKNLWAVNNASSYSNNVHIGSAGRFFGVSGSSKRWKNSIEDIRDEALDPHHLYGIEVKQFKFNTDYIKNEKDQRYDVPVVGFIAEQMQECYPIAVDVDEETGNAMDWNMKFIIPPMLALIQEQKKEIDHLTERVKILEERSVA